MPGYKAGGPIRSYANLVDHFKGEYEFYIVTRNTDYTETKPYEGITPDSWTTLDTNVYVWYCSPGFPSKQNFKRLLKDTEYDVLYVNGIYSWYFSILPLYLGKKIKKETVVVSVRGMLKRSAVNVKQGKKKLFITLIKRLRLYHGITLHATNEDEKQDIIQNFGDQLTVHVAPNLPRKIKSEFKPNEKTPGFLSLISIARISPEKNTLYALEILKQLSLSISKKPVPSSTGYRSPDSGLRSPVSNLTSPNNQLSANTYNLPAITFELFGSIYNPQYWDECQKIINELPDWIKVDYQGSLDSNEVLTKLSQSHFMFMPTRGENYGHAILESFSAGRPVIISDQTPWRELEKKGIGHDIPLEKPQLFVDALHTCLTMDQETYNTMSKATFDYAQKIIHDPQVIEANRELFR